jgi:hypothetical protein
MKPELQAVLEVLDSFPAVLTALYAASYTGQVILQLHCGRVQHVDLPQPPVRVAVERRRAERRTKSPHGA